MKKAIQLDEQQTKAFIDLMKQLHSMNWGSWPDASTWPDFGIGYSIVQYETPYGHATVVQFDKPVQLYGFSMANRLFAAGLGASRRLKAQWLGF